MVDCRVVQFRIPRVANRQRRDARPDLARIPFLRGRRLTEVCRAQSDEVVFGKRPLFQRMSAMDRQRSQSAVLKRITCERPIRCVIAKKSLVPVIEIAGGGWDGGRFTFNFPARFFARCDRNQVSALLAVAKYRKHQDT